MLFRWKTEPHDGVLVKGLQRGANRSRGWMGSGGQGCAGLGHSVAGSSGDRKGQSCDYVSGRSRWKFSSDCFGFLSETGSKGIS